MGPEGQGQKQCKGDTEGLISVWCKNFLVVEHVQQWTGQLGKGVFYHGRNSST